MNKYARRSKGLSLGSQCSQGKRIPCDDCGRNYQILSNGKVYKDSNGVPHKVCNKCFKKHSPVIRTHRAAFFGNRQI